MNQTRRVGNLHMVNPWSGTLGIYIDICIIFEGHLEVGGTY